MDAGGKLGTGIKDMFGGIKNKFKNGFGFGFGEQVALLTEIRDLLNTRLPGNRTRFKSNKNQQGSKSQPVADNKDQGSSSGGGFFSSLKDKATGIKTGLAKPLIKIKVLAIIQL